MWSAQAEEERLTLRVAENKAGYFGVCLANPGQSKAYKAQVWHGGTMVYLGRFATAEEAALCVARSKEGQAAAERTAVAPTPSVKEEGTVPPMPPGTFVKVEGIVKEEEGSGSRPKRGRTK